MPYKGEKAGKGGHSDIVKNKDVSDFLENCEYMKEPNDEEGKNIAATFMEVPKDGVLPQQVVASDASPYSDAISGKFPSTQIGYVKISFMLVDLQKYSDLKTTRYVDPFKVAELHRNANAISFTLPGSNVRYKNAQTVKSGFRLAVYEQYSDERTNFGGHGKPYTIKDTLIAINDDEIKITKCPNCGHQPSTEYILNKSKEIVECEVCDTDIYITDFMRLHEQISDYGDNASAITRFMNVTEHLLVASFIRMLSEQNPESLARLAFIIDGPLAIFGQPARIHARLMSFYHQVKEDLNELGFDMPLIIGLQKDGLVMEHARSISNYLKKETFRVVDDEYRSKYIKSGEVLNDNFGHETYYGQDFIYKTESGGIFTVGLIYPYKEKGTKEQFSKKKVNIEDYGKHLANAFELIKYFEFDLYENAVVPIALAHRHASISITPGGKVLDLVTRSGLDKK